MRGAPPSSDGERRNPSPWYLWGDGSLHNLSMCKARARCREAPIGGKRGGSDWGRKKVVQEKGFTGKSGYFGGEVLPEAKNGVSGKRGGKLSICSAHSKTNNNQTAKQKPSYPAYHYFMR